MRARALGIAAGLLGIPLGCADPVHDNQVSALGPEAAGVGPGPRHRPGQPCLACHGGSGPGSPQFSVAGTIYAAKDQATPLPEVGVQLVDANGALKSATTNAAGNFYIPVDQWEPTNPLHVSLKYKTVTREMTAHIGRSGSCADCHFNPPGPSTPGPVYVVLETGDLPGASP